MKLINEISKDTLYYYYYLNEWTYNENNPFPFEIIQNDTDLPCDFYCDDLTSEIDKMKISSPQNMVNFEVFKINENGIQNIYLKPRVNNANIDINNKELTISTENGSKFSWNNKTIEARKTNNGIEFSTTILLDLNQIDILSKNKISGFKIANHFQDSDELEARFLRGYIGCLKF